MSAGKPVVSVAAKRADARRKTRTPVAVKARRTRMSKDDRREQLVEHGLSAFLGRPYDQVTTTDIAKAAGVSQGLLFHYFPTKREFYIAVVELLASELTRETLAFTQGPVAQRFVSGVNAYFEFVERKPELYAMLIGAGSAIDPGVKEVLDRCRSQVTEAIMHDMPELPQHERATLRTSMRGFTAALEAIALDWHEHRDLSRITMVKLAVRALLMVAPSVAALVPEELRD